MKSDEREVSLYEVLKDRKFEASVITTYNVYFPFYEDVVLRRLSASGARHNVLIVDKKQLAECLNTPSLRPRKAGYEYTLIPMDFGGAFHPKISMLLERSKGVLFVGSHNMTLSGYGVNRELTTKIKIVAKDKSGIASARQIYHSLLEWLSSRQEVVPHYVDAIKSLPQIAPWLKGKIEEEAKGGIQLFLTDPSGDSLWQNVRKTLPTGYKRVLVLSPFFDSKLNFLSTLTSELRVDEVIVGIDPYTVDINKQQQLIGKFKFVDASQIYKGKGYLHAKAYWLEDHSGQSWLISGSANASNSAWLGTPSSRNIEAIVVHRGDEAKNAAQRIGITEIGNFPDISAAQWVEIGDRVKAKKEQERKTPLVLRTGEALYSEGQIFIQSGLVDESEFLTASLIGENNRMLGEITSLEHLGTYVALTIQSTETEISGIRFVQIQCRNNQQYLFYVHHQGHIERKLVGSHHAQFRASLESLSGDNPDIEKLILTVEKIIFDNPPEIPDHLKKKVVTKVIGLNGIENDEPLERKQIESLAVHLKETTIEKKRTRLMRSGDLGHLLDVLIHHLGIGLESSPGAGKDNTDHRGRSEEELVGSDDEEQHGNIKIDPGQIVKICNNKVHNLVGRMLKQLKKAALENDADHVIPIVQLVAVLALLRQLRLLDYRANWMPAGATLFAPKERVLLLEGCIKYLHGVSFNLLDKALQELNDEPMDEISRLHGLMLWLARECGKDIRSKTVLGEAPEQQKERILSKYLMMYLAPLAATDPVAVEEATSSIMSTAAPIRKVDSDEWVQKHLFWGRGLRSFTKQFSRVKTVGRTPTIGDIVYNTRLDKPVLSIVLRSAGKNTSFVNLEKENSEGSCLTSCLAVLDIPESILTLK